jgi:hypothetical protein
MLQLSGGMGMILLSKSDIRARIFFSHFGTPKSAGQSLLNFFGMEAFVVDQRRFTDWHLPR